MSAPSRRPRYLPVLEGSEPRPSPEPLAPPLGDAPGTGGSKPAEPDDPLALVGVPVPVDEATFDEMADVFIDEFVRDGWPDDRLVAAFRSPFYAGLHVVWRLRGEAWVRARIAAARDRWHRSSDGSLTRSPITATAPGPRGTPLVEEI
ncbi:MAG TPA: hypothetical protein VNO86_07915 [Candidatus Binatia bacterium]|nr:hypothetical protein [Candidatus Binatia bacterium]